MQTEHFNPVTRSLIQRLDDPHLAELVTHWDALEALVIRVFRRKAATAEDEAQFEQVVNWLGQAYPQRNSRFFTLQPVPSTGQTTTV